MLNLVGRALRHQLLLLTAVVEEWKYEEKHIFTRFLVVILMGGVGFCKEKTAQDTLNKNTELGKNKIIDSQSWE